MHRFTLAGALLPALFAAASGAQSSSVWTEADFLSALRDNHPAVREASEAVVLAEAELLAIRTWKNPALEIQREDPEGAVEQHELVFSWQPPHAARRARVAAKQHQLDAAHAQFSVVRLRLEVRLREIYANWAIAQQRARILEKQLARVEAVAAREQVRAELGETSGLAANRLRFAVATLRSRWALVDSKRQEARRAAAVWVPELPAEAEPVLPALAEATTTAGPSHSLLQAAQAQVDAARFEQRAEGRFISSPELSLGWQRHESAGATQSGPILGLNWSLPLFDRRQAAQLAAEARLDGALARLELLEREFSSARAASLERLEVLLEVYRQAEETLAVGERMVEGVEAAFRLGETDLTTLLDTYRAVTEAEGVLLDLHAASLAAHRDLARIGLRSASATTSEVSEQVSASLRNHFLQPSATASLQEAYP